MKQALVYLMLSILCLLAYATAFAMTQHAGWIESLYWAVATAETVGYGDVIPKNTTGQVIAILAMLTVVPLLGNALSHLHVHRLHSRILEPSGSGPAKRAPRSPMVVLGSFWRRGDRS